MAGIFALVLALTRETVEPVVTHGGSHAKMCNGWQLWIGEGIMQSMLCRVRRHCVGGRWHCSEGKGFPRTEPSTGPALH